MLDVVVPILTLILGSVGGFYYCAYRIAKDRHWVRLGEGEVVVDEPEKGNILVSVPPALARRLVAANENEDYGNTPEARNLYPERRLTGLVRKS